jgi:hypothetical protein
VQLHACAGLSPICEGLWASFHFLQLPSRRSHRAPQETVYCNRATLACTTPVELIGTRTSILQMRADPVTAGCVGTTPHDCIRLEVYWTKMRACVTITRLPLNRHQDGRPVDFVVVFSSFRIRFSPRRTRYFCHDRSPCRHQPAVLYNSSRSVARGSKRRRNLTDFVRND